MKRIIVYLILLWVSLFIQVPLHAQVVDVCAGDGTDSVTLSVSNFQYGLIQWQNSSDGVLWFDIEDANDTILRFLPIEEGYYRAVITYMDCPYDTSQVSHIKMTPKAYAGPDKLANAGYMTQLRGNELEGVRSMWEVLEGDNAIIDDVEDPYSLFSGTDTLYQLQWTLANECGVSHDTVAVRFVEPIFYDKIVVVDTTDQIFGDSLERHLGIYRIAFNDPVPVITDSTILVGIPYGGFLRKVVYAEHREDTVVMYTQQATLDDIIVRGAFSFDALASNGRHRDRGLYVRMDHLPTRAELQQNLTTRDGRIPYYEFPTETSNLATPSSIQSRGWNFGLTPFSGDHFDINANIKLQDVRFSFFDPFFDYSVEKNETGMVTSYYVGVENTVSFKLKVEGSFDVTALEVPIIPEMSYHKLVMLGWIPIEVGATYNFKAKLKGSASVSSKSFDCTGRVRMSLALDADVDNGTAHTRFDPPQNSLFILPEEGSSMNDVSVDLSFSLEHKVDLKLYEIIGPFFSVATPKMSVGMCHTVHNNDNIHNYHLKGEIPWEIGLKGTILKKDILDIHYEDSKEIFNWSRPGIVERHVDNSYNYHDFQVNDIVPIKVKVSGHAVQNLAESPLALNPLFQVYNDFTSLFDVNNTSLVMFPVSRAKVTFSTNDGTLGHLADESDPNVGYSGLSFTADPVDAYTDNNGIATVYWKPNNPMFNVIKARVTNCSGEDVKGSPLMITVDNCGTSDLHLDIVDGRLRPSGGLGSGYMYGTSISGIMPFEWDVHEPLTLTPGNTYFVKSGSCVASAVCPVKVCHLNVTHSLRGNNLVVAVRNGKGPYRFYLNDAFLSVSALPNTVVPLSENGTYSIKVVDADGCEAVDENIIFWDQKTVPVVYTNRAYNTANEVYDDVQGIILSDGNCNITERGIYWSASANMAPATKIVSNAITDDFVCHIPNVVQGQVLYACAYAVNEKGTGYGDTITLRNGERPAVVPTVSSTSVTSITSNSACSGGTVLDDGGADVIARGVCWSTIQNPTASNSHTTNGTGTGSFTSNLTGLSAGTTYYVRAYATNSVGTAYGSEMTFTTNSAYDGGQPCSDTPTVTDIDGNTYNTVQIGIQCWMKENLRTTHYSDGTSIPLSNTISYDVAYRYCPYNSSYASTYGHLYNWPAVMHNASSSNSNPSGVQGVCPAGWHVPSDAEWTQLTDYVSSKNEYLCVAYGSYIYSFEIAKALASVSGWVAGTADCAVGNNPSSNNATGFSAVPVGDIMTSYEGAGCLTSFWSTTQSSSLASYYRGLNFDRSGVVRGANNTYCGKSVRCLKDGVGEEIVTTPMVVTTPISSITPVSAYGGGVVLSHGGSDIIARGVCWSTDLNPSIDDNHTVDGFGTGEFYSIISNLTPNTTYYVRAYATNSVGTAYGEQVEFTTLDLQVDEHACSDMPFVVDHEGNGYRTVRVGEQCWMRENMRCTTSPSTGATILETSPSSYSCTGKKAYYVNGIPSNTATYGLLYNWNAAVDTFNTAYGETSANTFSNNSVNVTFSGNRRGICPQGWHLPSDAEWTTMVDYMISQSQYACGSDNTYIAKALASTSDWNSSTNTCVVGNNLMTNNVTGFSAVPAGGYYGYFDNLGSRAYLWTATQSNSSRANYRGLYYDRANVGSGLGGKNIGFSVRCLRD